ncbi:hypothetical protein ACWC6I_10515 [Streptomyces sp. NPDC001414]
MTSLSIDVTGLPAGTPVAAEIATSTGDVRKAVVVAGRPFVSDVVSGTYVVRLAAPGSGRASAVVAVAEGSEEEAGMAFDFAAPDAAWEGAPVFEVGRQPAISLFRSVLSRHARAARTMTPDEAVRAAEEMPGPALFVRDAMRTLLAPVEVRDTYVVRRSADGGGSIHVCVTAGPGTARFVALPSHSVARIRCAPEDGVMPMVSVRPTDVDARALLDFSAAARLGAALTVTSHVVQAVGERIDRGEGDAVAGCAVAHHLMSHPRRQWAQEWVHTLADAFPASVDVAVLAAWYGIALGSTVEAPPVRERLIAAADPARGLPVYLQSLQLLRAALERTYRADSADGAWDPRLEEALRCTQHYLSAAEPSEVFTSFTGRGPLFPRTPGATPDMTGVEPPASRAALADAVAALGLVGFGSHQRVVSGTGDSLTLDWAERPVADEVSLSLVGPAWGELAGTPLALVRTDSDDVELTRVSLDGHAVFALPHGASGRLLVPDETEDPPAVLVPPLPTRHAAAAGPETSRRVASQELEFVVEPVRGRDRWRVTARCFAKGDEPLWALVRQRSGENAPYLIFALPLRKYRGSWRESALLLGRASQQLDWYAAPEPVEELPARSAPLILERSLAHAANAWTRSALEGSLPRGGRRAPRKR